MTHFKIAQIKKAALIIAAVMIVITMNAIFKDYVKYRINLVELKNKEKQLATLERQRKSLVKELEIFNADKQALESKLFNENGLAEFLQRMPEDASRLGVKVLSLKAERNFRAVRETYPLGHKSWGSRDKSQPVLMSLPIRTVVEGPLASVVDFLIVLEKYKQLLSVNSVKIEVKKYPVIAGDFTLTAFIIKEEGS